MTQSSTPPPRLQVVAEAAVARRAAPATAFAWDDLRFFLAVARSGNPTRAARWLGADHTTVRRRIAALEAALRAKLFDSRDTGYALTPQGEQLLRSAEAMESLAIGIEGDVAETDNAVSGLVRIGASHGFAAYFLASRLPRLCARHPDLNLQLVVLSRVANVAKREVDVAIAPMAPSRGREVVRKLTDCRLGLYASAAYLASRPVIRTLEDLEQHTVIGYINDQPFAPDQHFLPRAPSTVEPAFQSNSIIAQIRAALAGEGLVVLPHFIACQEQLNPVLAAEFAQRREYWSVIHPDMRKLARVRVVADFVAEQVAAARGQFLAGGGDLRVVQAASEEPRSAPLSEQSARTDRAALAATA